jgi:hypothetical protein
LGISYGGRDGRATSCAITWVSYMAMVELPRVGQPEPDLLDAMDLTDWTGIAGAPFGWPDAMLDAISRYSETGRWPVDVPADRVRFRETDRFVRRLLGDCCQDVAIVPATSREATLAAWRCARLLTLHGDRTGRDLDRIGVPAPSGMDGAPDPPRGKVPFPPAGVIEAHVPATLAAWGFPHDGYRAADQAESARARDRREVILDQLEDEAGWLLLPDDARESCLTCDDALEALVAAFVACAAATDMTIKPTVEQRGAAQREGWIHLPWLGSLTDLAPAT